MKPVTLMLFSLLTLAAPLPALAQSAMSGVDMASPRMTEAEVSRDDVIASLEAATTEKPADFTRMRLNGLDLSNLDFTGAIFRAAAMNSVNLNNSTLDNAVLDQAWVLRADLSNASLKGASLFMTQFGNANLNDADLSRSRAAADFTRASLIGASFREADLSADMKNQSMGLMRGVLRKANADGADFTGAMLSRADLEFAKLRGANFSDADLSMTTLAGADFTGADISRAQFDNADVTSTKLKSLIGNTNDQFDTMRNLSRAFRK